MKKANIASFFSTLFRGYGFNEKSSCFYKSTTDLACFIDFQKNRGTIYVSFSLFPFYIPSDFRYITYGNRLEVFTKHQVNPLPTENIGDNELFQWVDSVKRLMEREIIPFLQTHLSANSLLEYLKKTCPLNDRFFSCSYYHFYKLGLFSAIRCNDKAFESIFYEKCLDSICNYPFTRDSLSSENNLLNLAKELMKSEEETKEEIINMIVNETRQKIINYN